MTREEMLRSRCTDADWAVWHTRAKVDAVWARTNAHRRRVDAARRALTETLSGERGYVGVSWGKDSCSVLRLCIEAGCDWPIVHVRIEPVANPDCATVRDAWLSFYPHLRPRYHEVIVRCQTKPSTGRYDTNLAYETGFRAAARRFGDRYVSGVRSEESGARKLTMMRNGLGSCESRTSRPIGRWTSEDVFAFVQDLPIAPAYPCSMSGAYDRGRVRLNNLWGLYGEGHGRASWEATYYRADIRRIQDQHKTDAVAHGEFADFVPRIRSWSDHVAPSSVA